MAQEQVIDDDLALIREREEQIRELEVSFILAEVSETRSHWNVSNFFHCIMESNQFGYILRTNKLKGHFSPQLGRH